MTKFITFDAEHSVFRCEKCGYITSPFEADGPYENGWNFCPACGDIIARSYADAAEEAAENALKKIGGIIHGSEK